MVFNGDSNDQDICTLADDFVKTDDTDFSLKQKARFATMAIREIFSWILSVYGGWIYDDKGNTNLPEATANLYADQQVYKLPDIAELKGVSYKGQNIDSWFKLKPITLEEIEAMGYSESEFERLSGTPIYYRPIADAFKVYPASNYDQDASIGIHFNRVDTAFSPTDTTKTPGFASQFHDALAVGMSKLFAEINTLDVLSSLRDKWDGDEDNTGREGGFKKRIKDYYRARYAEKFPVKMSNKPRRDFVDQYV